MCTVGQLTHTFGLADFPLVGSCASPDMGVIEMLSATGVPVLGLGFSHSELEALSRRAGQRHKGN